MAAIRVDVTAGDIAAAPDFRSSRGWSLPVEIALGRVANVPVVSVDGDAEDNIATIGSGDTTLVVTLPDDANEWLNRRWHGEAEGEPFAFDLEVEDWLVLLLTPEVAR